MSLMKLQESLETFENQADVKAYQNGEFVDDYSWKISLRLVHTLKANSGLFGFASIQHKSPRDGRFAFVSS